MEQIVGHLLSDFGILNAPFAGAFTALGHTPGAAWRSR
jgi:hypothetical protein